MLLALNCVLSSQKRNKSVYEKPFPGIFPDEGISEQSIQIPSLYFEECGNGKYKVATITPAVHAALLVSAFSPTKLLSSGRNLVFLFSLLGVSRFLSFSLRDIFGFRGLYCAASDIGQLTAQQTFRIPSRIKRNSSLLNKRSR